MPLPPPETFPGEKPFSQDGDPQRSVLSPLLRRSGPTSGPSTIPATRRSGGRGRPSSPSRRGTCRASGGSSGIFWPRSSGSHRSQSPRWTRTPRYKKEHTGRGRRKPHKRKPHKGNAHHGEDAHGGCPAAVWHFLCGGWGSLRDGRDFGIGPLTAPHEGKGPGQGLSLWVSGGLSLGGPVPVPLTCTGSLDLHHFPGSVSASVSVPALPSQELRERFPMTKERRLGRPETFLPWKPSDSESGGFPHIALKMMPDECWLGAASFTCPRTKKSQSQASFAHARHLGRHVRPRRSMVSRTAMSW